MAKKISSALCDVFDEDIRTESCLQTTPVPSFQMSYPYPAALDHPHELSNNASLLHYPSPR